MVEFGRMCRIHYANAIFLIKGNVRKISVCQTVACVQFACMCVCDWKSGGDGEGVGEIAGDRNGDDICRFMPRFFFLQFLFRIRRVIEIESIRSHVVFSSNI